MYLEEIELYNYRPYYDYNSITLGYEPNNNVNVIYANNARGKSSLLNAITWAFYGKELHDEGEKANPIYNKIARNECKVGNTFKVYVKLKLFKFDENGKKIPFKVERIEEYLKEDNGKITFQNQELNVLDLEGEWSDDQTRIDATISKLMHKYFFFNGEQLDDYFNKKDIKNTIEKISQIDLISTVYDHLLYVNGKYNEEIKNLDEDLGPVTNKLNSCTQKLNEFETKRKKFEEDVDELNDIIKKCDETLDELKEAKKLSKERNDLLDENSKINNRLPQNKENYANQVVELYSIINLFDRLIEVTGITRENETEIDVTLSKKVKELYEYVLEQQVCICGVDFNENPQHRLEIQEKLDLLNAYHEGDNTEEEDIEDHIKDIKNVLKSIKPRYDAINVLRQSISVDSKTLNDNNKRLLEISNSLTDNEDDEIKDTEKWRKTTEEALNKKSAKLKKLENDIGGVQVVIKQLTKKRDKILDNISESNELKMQLKFCERAVDLITDLNSNLKRDILDKITDIINSQVSSSDFSEEGLGLVTIDDKFNVSLKDFLDEPLFPADLSGGERRSLALAFIIALNSISGFDLPLFIDAPFSTLDDEYIQKFIDNLPKFTTDKQLIFLFIADTYNKGIDKMLNPYINKKIELVKKQKYITEVVPR